MHTTLNKRDPLVFAVTPIRCPTGKHVLTKEDIMADLGKQGICAETAFKIEVLFNETPRQ